MLNETLGKRILADLLRASGLAAFCAMSGTVVLPQPVSAEAGEPGAPTVSWGLPFGKSECWEDNAIPLARRAAIEDLSLEFAERLRKGDAAGAYSLLSSELRGEQTREEFTSRMKALVAAISVMQDIKVTRRYYLRVQGIPNRVMCGTIKGDAWASVAVAKDQEQAHVELSGRNRNNVLVLALWLVLEQADWRVQGFHLGVGSFGDRVPETLRELARGQLGKGNKLSARMFYLAALEAAERGQNMQLGVQSKMIKELSQIDEPPELRGTPPFQWKKDSRTFAVLGLNPLSLSNKMMLVVSYQVEQLAGPADAERQNDEMRVEFTRRFPEWTDAFDILVLEARLRDGTGGFRTLVERAGPRSGGHPSSR
jgi:hypothetical protein